MHLPKLPQRFVPYIYSHAELKRLTEAIPACFGNHRRRIDAGTYRTSAYSLFQGRLSSFFHRVPVRGSLVL